MKKIYLLTSFLLTVLCACARPMDGSDTTQLPTPVDLGNVPPPVVKVGETLLLKINGVPAGQKLSLVKVRKGDEIGKVHLSTDNILTYTPDADDYFAFEVGLKHGDNVDTLLITPYQPFSAENEYIQNTTALPATTSEMYRSTTVATSTDTVEWNHERTPTRQIKLVGKSILFDLSTDNRFLDILKSNKADSVCDRDIASLSIYCDTLTLKTKLWLPQTSVTIYCRVIQLQHPDATDVSAGDPGFIVTTPVDFPTGKGANDIGKNGDNGKSAGSLQIHCQQILSDARDKLFFVTSGGNGQDGGPGKDGAANTSPVGKDITLNGNELRKDDYKYTVTSVIYQENGGGNRVLYGSKKDRAASGGDATGPGYGGLPGRGGDITININDPSLLPPGSTAADPGQPGHIFQEKAVPFRVYKGGAGQRASWLIGGGPAYPPSCSNCVRVLQTLTIVPKNGEDGDEFPPKPRLGFRSHLEEKLVDDSIKGIESTFKGQSHGFTYSFNHSGPDGCFDSCIVSGYFAGSRFPTPIARIFIGDDFSKNSTGLNDTLFYIRERYSKPYFNQVERSTKEPRQATVVVEPDSHHGWISPEYGEKQLLYIKDVYLAGNLDTTKVLLEAFQSDLIPATSDTASSSFLPLSKLYEEGLGLYNRVESNLDYFGNPAGYCPLLSFWVNKILYENALDASINNIILCRRLLRKQQTMKEKEADLSKMIENTWSQIASERPRLDEMNGELSGLLNDADGITDTINLIEPRIAAREKDLEERAVINVKMAHAVPEWKQAAHIVAFACKVIPVYQPVLAIIGEGIDLATRTSDQSPLLSIMQAADIYDRLNDSAFKASKENLDQQEDQFSRKGRNVVSYGRAMYDVYNNQYAPALKRIIEASQTEEVDQREVIAMLQTVEQEDPEYADLTAQVKELSTREANFMQQVKQIMNDIVTLRADISSKVLQAASLEDINRQLTSANLSADGQSTFKTIETRNLDNLLEYTYYLSKAYEYRMLEPYNQPLSSESLFNELDRFFEQADLKDLDATRAAIIKMLYTDKINSIYHDFVAKLNQEGFVHSTETLPFRLSPAQLNTLNTVGSIDLRLPKDILDYIQSTSDKTYSLINSITAKQIEIANPERVTGNVKLELAIKNNNSVISYKDRRILFRLGNGRSPLYFAEATFDPTTRQTTNSLRNDFDLNDFQALTGITAPQIADIHNYFSFFNKPSLESTLHIELNQLSLDKKIESLELELDYGYIPINDYRTFQIILDPIVQPAYLIRNLTKGQTYYYQGEVSRVFQLHDKIQLSVPRYVGKYTFDHWEDYGGHVLSSAPTFTVAVLYSYVVARPVYTNK